MSVAAAQGVSGSVDPRYASALDGALVGRLGDCPAALAEIYRRHAGRVFSSAAAVLRDESRAGEISQEVFLRLWREPARFDASLGSLGAFLCMQARRRAIDEVRADQARHRRETRTVFDRSTADADGAPWRATWGAHVRSAVASLSASEREPIELAFFGGYTYREVAGILAQPEGTIKGRIRAGLRKLGETLGDHGVPADA